MYFCSTQLKKLGASPATEPIERQLQPQSQPQQPPAMVRYPTKRSISPEPPSRAPRMLLQDREWPPKRPMLDYDNDDGYRNMPSKPMPTKPIQPSESYSNESVYQTPEYNSIREKQTGWRPADDRFYS